ncbi:hypothetical protein [Methylocystis bryophila]|uniref:Uncharacterized protein n=1 Tax=Methylocystis bryophila TaxID=655015 RepID=A0A1W6N079_9HYPH|nr:hypothetical protein [Methylocystis bryophila]ARN83209.1 hypothetical protein B1812_21390 [Methylocystis bryophila]BDV39550.1 hypothetical protein DSM21852_28030 [Methylocystis bryophila]
MTSIRFAASIAFVLALTMPAAAVAINLETPFGAGLGWQAYRAAGTHAYPLRVLAPRIRIEGIYRSSGEQERVAPQR